MMEQALTTLEKSLSLPREKQFVWAMPAWPYGHVRNGGRLRGIK